MPETDLKRTDYEPYFERWNAAQFFPNPSRQGQKKIHGFTGEPGMVPVYIHKTCDAYVILGFGGNGKYPPRVCPGCGVDTATEVKSDETPTIEVPSGFRSS